MRGPVRSPADAAKGDAKLKELFFFDMLAHGIWLARRGMMTLCLPIGDAECDQAGRRGGGVPVQPEVAAIRGRVTRIGLQQRKRPVGR